MDVKAGDVLGGKFLVVKHLGEGNGRISVLARAVRSSQLVTLEVMPPGTSERSTAMRFARAKQIASHHVPAFIDIGCVGERPYVATEHLEGNNLRELHQGKAVPVAHAVDYILEACDALAAAHAVGLVHRRLTPASLLCATKNGALTLKVLDLTSMPSRTATGEPTDDTNEYAAPELFDRAAEVDRRCDVWALGVILYELLTGRHPFAARDPRSLAKRVRDESPKAPHALKRDVPMPLGDAVLRCLEKSPAGRWQTVAELGLALAPFGTTATRGIAARLARSPAPSGPDQTLRPPPKNGFSARVDERADGITGKPARSAQAPDESDNAIRQPNFDERPGEAAGFRKMMKDGRIEDLTADSAVKLVRAKRITSDAIALAKRGPRTTAAAVAEADDEMRPIGDAKPLSIKPMKPPSRRPEAPIAVAAAPVDAAAERRRKMLAILILVIAVTFGLLVGLVVKIVMGR